MDARALRSLLVAVVVPLVGIACGDFSGSSSGQAQSGPATLNLTASAADIAAFEATLHPMLRTYCASCHEGNGPGTPHFARVDATAAHQALMGQGKANLGNPGASRVVVKVGQGHHCWNDCAADGAALAAAIQAWADQIQYDEGGISVQGTLASTSATLDDGVVDTGSERYAGNLIGLWEFKEGSGAIAHDTSGVAPALDLEANGGVAWLSNWGVAFDEGFLRGTEAASRKLYDRIASPEVGTQQYSVEAWVIPANIDQEGPRRIATYSRNGGARNLTLGQQMYTYDFRNRSIHPALEDWVNGRPTLRTADADQDAQDRLQHVVLTYDQYRGRRVYVDGVFTGDAEPVGAARLWNWDPSYRFALGAEPNGNETWLGQMRLAAVYQQALTDEQIQQNFAAGVGERLVLRFDVSEWMGSGSVIEFIVSEFDDYSYLFCQPTLRTPEPNGTRISNLRIAVNGQLAPSGQGWVGLDVPAVATHQQLSRGCTVIPKGGQATDTFTLVFERLGGYQSIVVEDPVDPAPVPLDPSPRPHNGVRDFARLDASFAALTGRSRAVGAATFSAIEQQLPEGPDARSFVSSHQVAIAKLALDYCDDLVESPDRAIYFPGFDFGAPADAAFDTAAERDLVFVPLFDRAVGAGLVMQPDQAEVFGALDTMVDDLLASCAGSCDAERTRTIVKGSCAAVLASAAVAIH